MKVLFALTTIALALTACGKAPLTDAQKQALRDLTSSTGAAQQAAMPAQPADSVAASAVTANPQALHEMKTRLNAGACHPTFTPFGTNAVNGSTGFPSGMTYRLALQAQGEGCPVSLDLDFSLVQSFGAQGFSIDGKLKTSYVVRDPEYRKFNDVDAFTIEGPLQAIANTQSYSVQGQWKGQIHSQSQGMIDFTARTDGSGTPDKMELEETISFGFPTFTAELKEKLQGGTTHYFLNDQEVSATEFQAYLDNGGPLLQRLGSPEAGIDHNVPAAPGPGSSLPPVGIPHPRH